MRKLFLGLLTAGLLTGIAGSAHALSQGITIYYTFQDGNPLLASQLNNSFQHLVDLEKGVRAYFPGTDSVKIKYVLMDTLKEKTLTAGIVVVGELKSATAGDSLVWHVANIERANLDSLQIGDASLAIGFAGGSSSASGLRWAFPYARVDTAIGDTARYRRAHLDTTEVDSLHADELDATVAQFGTVNMGGTPVVGFSLASTAGQPAFLSDLTVDTLTAPGLVLAQTNDLRDSIGVALTDSLGYKARTFDNGVTVTINGHAVLDTTRIDSGRVTDLQVLTSATLPSGTTAGNLTFTDGSITSASGAISFGNENLSTTGTLAAGATTLSGDLVIGNGYGVLLGNSSQISAGGGVVAEFQQWGTSYNQYAQVLGANILGVDGPRQYYVKSRNASIGGFTIVQNGDTVLDLKGFADDGTDYNSQVAAITMSIDGTPGLNDMPGRIVFSTTADGAAVLTEALRIDSGQKIYNRQDNAGVYTGAGDDLRIYHDPAAAGTGYIVNSTGGLYLLSGTAIAFENAAGTETMAHFAENGAVNLYYDNSAKLATTSAGGTLTGTWLASNGIYIGVSSLANVIDDGSSGASSTTLYIGNASINVTSDRRAKRDIEDFTGAQALDLLSQAHVVSFNYIPEMIHDESPYGPSSRGRYVGMIAQEMKQWAPWAINDGDGEEHPGVMWKAEYQHLVPLLISAVNEQQREIDALKAKLN